MTSFHANVLGGQVHYTTHGPSIASAREVFICLHGNSSSVQAFQPLLQKFSQDIHVICIDFPGHGQSGRAEQFRKYYSFQGFSDVLLAFIEAVGLEPTGIIGHSMGGHIALQAASRIRSLLRLVLMSSPPIAGAAAIPSFFRENAPLGSIFTETLTHAELEDLSIAFTTRDTPALARQILTRDIAHTDGVFRAELGKSLQGSDVVDEAAILKTLSGVEVLLVGGDADAFIDPRYYGAIRVGLGLGDEQSQILPGVGHYPHLEAPEATADIITAWLNTARASAAAAKI